MRTAGGGFDPATHRYTYAGRGVPSVTQVLEDNGVADFSGVDPDVLERARWRGTEVHGSIRGLLGEITADPEAPDELKPYVDAAKRFIRDQSVEARVIESPAIGSHLGLRFGYTPDVVGFRRGEHVILDWKTGSPSRSWGPQLAAYEIAERVLDGVQRKRIAVQLLPTGNYRIHEYGDANDYAVWQAALYLTYWKGWKP